MGKKRMGRPPKPKAERLSEIINLRMTPGERRRFEELARLEGCTISELILRPWRKES
ncbi:MAG: hypothetical protein AMXMBFR7_09620 [Planctomycetota bacterium]